MSNLWKLASKPPPKKSKDWLIQILAKNRGLNTKKQLDEFLNPNLEQILAVKLSGLEKGVSRAIQAIKNKEKIIVYSDYDADGICATAIMWETLYDLGADVMPYVPHRVREGYGLAKDAISELAKKGVDLIITVDHGVTAVEQVEHAKSLGVDVIITDHHVLPDKLPKSIALVHTTDLCGTGVSWRFCYELIKKLAPNYEDKLIEKLELAAIATIADLVPLIGGNRAIVKLGLVTLTKTKRPGIRALLNASGVSGDIGTYEIGHILAPRINAMGRIEHGLDSLRLICAKNQSQADKLAQLLARTNSKRQDLTASAITRAMDLVLKDDAVGVIANTSWHEGVIGLVASRLVETHHKPMIVISQGEVYSKGSARSIPGFNIVEAIRQSSEFLVDAGGHPMAAGFTIETRHIEAFRQKLNKYARTIITEEILTPVIKIECELQKEEITRETYQIVKKFEPYGMANPEPLFLTRNMVVEEARGVGQDSKHLKLQVDGFGAIGFNLGEHRSEIRPGYMVNLVYTIAQDNYNDNNNLQLKIKDLQINNN